MSEPKSGLQKAAPGLSDSNNTYNLTREVGRAVAAILAMGEESPGSTEQDAG